MSLEIIISSGCQTGSLTAALKALFTNTRITPWPLPAGTTFTDEAAELALAERLKTSQSWITIGFEYLLEKHGVMAANPGLKVIKTPSIMFPAFHPDLVYAKVISSGEIIVHHYNSAIAVWAYNHGLTIPDAAKLYNELSFSQLGYLDKWPASVSYMRDEFQNAGLDFARFFLAVKRSGIFMHSINHPKVGSLIQLARVLALRLGADESVFEIPIEIEDTLGSNAWPVYPDIGNHLAMPSSWTWKMNGQYINGLEAYLAYAFGNYEQQGIARGDIAAFIPDPAIFDHVLGGQIHHG